eukprot:gene8189-16836_t
MNNLKLVDEVRTFPNLTMPPPAHKDYNQRRSGRKSTKSSEFRQNAIKAQLDRTLEKSSSEDSKTTDSLPGILKLAKVAPSSTMRSSSGDMPPFVGFNASNMVFDGLSKPLSFISSIQMELPVQSHPTLSLVNVTNQSLPNNNTNNNSNNNSNPPTIQRQSSMLATSLAELRNYSVLMDQYSLHNFLIWNGKSLRNTPEFQSFRRTYDHDWGPISSIIAALEEMMTRYGVKLAIVNGQKTAEFALCGLPYHEEFDLLNCITNIEQIKPTISSFVREGGTDRNRAIVKMQAVIRQWIARRQYQHLLLTIKSAVKMQSIARMFIHRCRALALIGRFQATAEQQWVANTALLKRMWTESLTPGKPRLIIHIPSVQAPESVRLDIDNFAALQNSHISCLHHLEDPDVHIAYVCPCQFGVPEQTYHDRFLQALGVSTLPKRLRFIVPDMLKRLRPHTPLAQVLWYCSATLRRLRALAKQFAHAVIVCSSVGWAEKRISNFLKIPLLAPDSTVTDTLSGPSYSKQVFLDCNVNIPLGAHDLSSEEDFMLSLARLISSNLDVHRWLIRLNSDVSNETMAYVDVERIAIVKVLRNEQTALMQRHNGDYEAWYSKHVQASARKRLLAALESELASMVKICRVDIFPDWETYMVFLGRFGAVIEAEAPEILGYVEGLCFVDPLGGVHGVRGVDCIVDDLYQPLSYMYPQMVTPPQALEGATMAVARSLFAKWGVVGYVHTSFISYWDSYNGIPRLWALGLRFGMTAPFGGIGTLSVAMRNGEGPKARSNNESVPPSLCFLPAITE